MNKLMFRSVLITTNLLSWAIVTMVLFVGDRYRTSLLIPSTTSRRLQRGDECCDCFQVGCEWIGTCPLNFYAIADVPYTDRVRGGLHRQVMALDVAADVDFMIHIGDIKNSDVECTPEALQLADDVLRDSPVPVFVVVGDNEYNDCANPTAALDIWIQKFERYDIRYRTHDMRVEQHPTRKEVFFFVHKRTLLFGLNLVGGVIQDRNEWDQRHAEQLSWVKEIMLQEMDDILAVVFFGHADPYSAHADFFNPLIVFLRREFRTDIPLLYMCGDAHAWSYDTEFLEVTNMERIRLRGGVEEPILKVTVDTVAGQREGGQGISFQRYL